MAASVRLVVLLVLLAWSRNLLAEAPAPSASGRVYQPRVRAYFVAAEDVNWDYLPSGENRIKPGVAMGPWDHTRVYPKTRYVEYTDATFTTPKPQPEHLGILGPTIRGVVGDTLQIHFKNKASRPYSMHPHGVRYDKDNEGAPYGNLQGKGHAIAPGKTYVYTWEVPETAGPGSSDTSSVVWLYHSHVESCMDIYRGLVGTLIITDPRHATDDARPDDVDREFVNLFLIFNENHGQMDSAEHAQHERAEHEHAAHEHPSADAVDAIEAAADAGLSEEEIEEGNLKHAINGYLFGNQPGLMMNQGERVRWYLVALGTETDMHTPHWHGQTVLHEGRRTDVVSLLPAAMTQVDMRADNTGTWMFHCHVGDHMTAGMSSLYTIRPGSAARQ